MKKILLPIIFLISTLFCNAQYYNIGFMSRQFTNQNQTQQDINSTSGAYMTNNQTLNGELFVEKVMSTDMFYRLTVGTNRVTSNALSQNVYEGYFSDNIILLSKTYNVGKTMQSYDAYIGVGKIFYYNKFSLRTGASVGYIRSQTTNTTVKGVIENSDYVAVNSYTSQTPYNEYRLNFHASLHYTFWNGLSAGFQIDNWISYIAEKTVVTTTTQGFATGGMPTSVTSSINNINNRVISTSFLSPDISIIYSFRKSEAPVNTKKTGQ
ncbi:MAG TPA: hypothetical protein VK809_01015 [Bacteroidia bacterium]|jgi:hypothetical protein|nr:hypothetical protein [Bacteroidia bacterium]